MEPILNLSSQIQKLVKYKKNLITNFSQLFNKTNSRENTEILSPLI